MNTWFDGSTIKGIREAVASYAASIEGIWLEGVLATTALITPTPREIERRLGADSSAYALDAAELAALYRAHRHRPELLVTSDAFDSQPHPCRVGHTA